MEVNYRLLKTDSDSEAAQWLDLHRICFQQPVSKELWHWIHL